MSDNKTSIEIRVPLDVYEEFEKYAESIGTTDSSFTEAKMREFIKEEKVREKLKERHKF